MRSRRPASHSPGATGPGARLLRIAAATLSGACGGPSSVTRPSLSTTTSRTRVSRHNSSSGSPGYPTVTNCSRRSGIARSPAGNTPTSNQGSASGRLRDAPLVRSSGSGRTPAFRHAAAAASRRSGSVVSIANSTVASVTGFIPSGRSFRSAGPAASGAGVTHLGRSPGVARRRPRAPPVRTLAGRQRPSSDSRRRNREKIPVHPGRGPESERSADSGRSVLVGPPARVSRCRAAMSSS